MMPLASPRARASLRPCLALAALALLACASPSERLADAIAARDAEAVKGALAAGADVNERIGRLPPLCVALDRRAGAPVVAALLEAGA
ncbi:MAG: hypothetical protein AAF447_21080, partial [Myxococcota bacterium]